MKIADLEKTPKSTGYISARIPTLTAERIDVVLAKAKEQGVNTSKSHLVSVALDRFLTELEADE